MALPPASMVPEELAASKLFCTQYTCEAPQLQSTGYGFVDLRWRLRRTPGVPQPSGRQVAAFVLQLRACVPPKHARDQPLRCPRTDPAAGDSGEASGGGGAGGGPAGGSAGSEAGAGAGAGAGRDARTPVAPRMDVAAPPSDQTAWSTVSHCIHSTACRARAWHQEWPWYQFRVLAAVGYRPREAPPGTPKPCASDVKALADALDLTPKELTPYTSRLATVTAWSPASAPTHTMTVPHLMRAVRAGDAPAMRNLFKVPTSVLAAFSGHPALPGMWLQPIHVAALQAAPEIMDLLILYGADPDAKIGVGPKFDGMNRVGLSAHGLLDRSGAPPDVIEKCLATLEAGRRQGSLVLRQCRCLLLEKKRPRTHSHFSQLSKYTLVQILSYLVRLPPPELPWRHRFLGVGLPVLMLARAWGWGDVQMPAHIHVRVKKGALRREPDCVIPIFKKSR